MGLIRPNNAGKKVKSIISATKIVEAASNPKSAVGLKLENINIKNPATNIPVVVVIANPVVIIVLSFASR